MIRINEMSISIPGGDEDQGNLIGSEVARLLADKLPRDMGSRQIPEMSISMEAFDPKDPHGTANRIVEEIIRQLHFITIGT